MKEDKKIDLKQRIRNAAQAGYAGEPETGQDNREQSISAIEIEAADIKQMERQDEKILHEEPQITQPHPKVGVDETEVASEIKVKDKAIKEEPKPKVKKEKVPREKKQKIKLPKKERTDMEMKISKRSFLLALIILLLLITTASVTVIVAKMADKTAGDRKEAIAGTKNYGPEIREVNNSADIQEGDLITSASDEQERLNALAEDSRVYCIISSSPYFPDSNSKGSLYISNPEESKYYTQVIIKTEDDVELYISPLLAPNEKVEYDYLSNQDMEPGSYPANAYFNYYGSQESASYLGSMCANIKVVID